MSVHDSLPSPAAVIFEVKPYDVSSILAGLVDQVISFLLSRRKLAKNTIVRRLIGYRFPDIPDSAILSSSHAKFSSTSSIAQRTPPFGPSSSRSITSSTLTSSRTSNEASYGMFSFAGSKFPAEQGRLIAVINCWRPFTKVDFPEPGGPIGIKMVRIVDGSDTNRLVDVRVASFGVTSPVE